MCVYIYIYICLYMYIYIYIYTYKYRVLAALHGVERVGQLAGSGGREQAGLDLPVCNRVIIIIIIIIIILLQK